MDFEVIWWFLTVGGCSFLGGFAASLLITGWGLATLERRVKTLETREAGLKGVEGRIEKAAGRQELLAGIAQTFKDESIPKEEKMQRALALIAQNPEAAESLFRKIQKWL